MKKMAINWNINYGIASAAEDFQKLQVEAEDIMPINLSDDWLELREKLISARDEVFGKYGFDFAKKLEYSFDVLYGLKVYQILNKKIGFNLRQAGDDNIWRFLSVRVIPDIVHSRFGLNEDHFFRLNRRIWLKTIWWYIHLGWTGDEEGTWDLLKQNTTDTILQLVERPGLGYYSAVDHEILVQYKEYRDAKVVNATDIFREVLKLNVAKLPTTSPELIEGGIPVYVKSLFEAVI
ncbi:hypothetical protein BTI74_05885 [Lactobacillus delbrueckii subsp. bulgaricus]|jgi:hypothetical protein|nr:hypothetical protein [Lactobacillus delbrueckii]MBT8803594.1 hypothetical protein [Lactobacillus delbrueckii subsp. bulgaricus]MCS8615476.1 hypothetical protein [Lactobacillus delbrueckii subsp. lactis]MBT8833867.1 hypothetical protein [Lactobacillus delbrueckii subsp. bulgaricus]MBT8844726.1 hypothetical protein [Lactobacillus delbrueckii subsp. bulgaricus]